MKKVSFFKVAAASLFIASVVFVGCSKSGINTRESLSSSGDAAALNEPGTGNPKFQDCPAIEQDGFTTSSYHFTGAIVGLGNAAGRDAQLRIVAYISATPECENPGGKIVAAQSKVFEKTIDRTYAVDQNGKFVFDETSTPIYPADFGKVCPNGKWDLRIKSVTLLEWHIYVDGNEVTNTTGNTTCN